MHTQFSRDRHSAGLNRMSKLSVTTFHSNLQPSVSLKQDNKLFDFHRDRLRRSSKGLHQYKQTQLPHTVNAAGCCTLIPLSQLGCQV